MSDGSDKEEQSHCTFVNPACPDDLCVLEYGHPWASRNRHITGTTYGSANTTREEQAVILRNKALSGWAVGYLASKGTSQEELIKLGWKKQEELIEKGKQ